MPEQPDTGEAWAVRCPRCRYDTRALLSERCPECGLTRAEADDILAKRALMAVSAPRIFYAALTTLLGAACGLVAAGILREAWWRGLDGTDVVNTPIVLSILGAEAAIAVINWVRLAKRRPMVHPAWPGGLLFLLLTGAPAP